MEPSSPFSPSPAVAVGDDAGSSPQAPRRASPNPHATIKSPRSVRFIPTAAAADDHDSSKHSSAISPSGSFLGTDHDPHDMLSSLTNPAVRQEELPPFRLTREDVEAAFEFLDVNGSGILTMSNLKQRLSAFYPQLTSKEYKFLVEDPSGNNSVASGNQGGSPGEVGNTAHGYASPFAADGPKTDTARGQGGVTKAVVNESFGAHPDASAAADTAHAGSPSRVYGSRAGLDVDQLWDLIQSFQHLQLNLGASSAATDGAAYRASAGSGGRRPGGGATSSSSPAYDANIAASLLHGSGEDGFDAVGEAFRVYDPRNTHYVEKDVLSRIMAQIGFGELNDEDLTLLIGTADFDGDGRISLEDFRRLVNMKGRFKKE